MRTIFDIGVNNGDDSFFYLQKGFRVIGVEANPDLCSDLRIRFAKEISSQQYTLVDRAVVADERVASIEFFVNRNNSHWSSIFSSYGDRDGGSYSIEMPTVTMPSLLRKFGVPHYMKIDVEGMDVEIIKSLKPFKKPEFVSIEEFQGVTCLEMLLDVGFDKFKFAPQRFKIPPKAPSPSLEGDYFDRTFTGEDSGCFGKELAGRWLSFSEAKDFMRQCIRNDDGAWVGGEGEWFDVHATQSVWRRTLNRLLG